MEKMKFLDPLAQADFVRANPPLVFPVHGKVPKYCFQVSSSWWSSYEKFLDLPDPKSEDFLGNIDNSLIRDSDTTSFVYINETLWLYLGKIYGYRNKRKIYIIEGMPVHTTISIQVSYVKQISKIVKLPSSMEVKQFMKIVAKKFKIALADCKFYVEMPTGYIIKLRKMFSTLKECGINDGTKINVKKTNKTLNVPEIDIREEENEDEDFNKDFCSSIEFKENRNIDLDKLKEIQEVVSTAFIPKFALKVKSLKSIMESLRLIESMID